MNTTLPKNIDHKLFSLAVTLLFGVVSNCAASSSTLLLDFGPTVVAPAEATLDMGHFSGAVPNTQISWNTIVNANNSSLVYADGTSASGVSLVVGRSDAGVNNSIDFNNKLITSSALGSAENVGIYTNTSPTKDGIFATGTSTVNTNALGVYVSGLAAGTYTIYISGRNTSTGGTAADRIFTTNGPVSTSFSFSTNTTPYAVEANSAAPPGTLPNGALAITSTFAYGDNCVLGTVTLNAGDAIYLASMGVTNELRGFLNAVEIVPGLPVLTNFPATIGVEPQSVSAYAGSTVTIGGAQFGGVPPLFYQWYSNSVPIVGATNTSLVLSNANSSMSAIYNISVSNEINVAVSSNATLTIVPLFNTAQMTNLWNILPSDTNHPYVTTTAGGERGLAYDSVTSSLLVITHVPTNNLVVLDPATGNQKYLMNVSASGMVTNAAGINMIGVADDGTVYAGNVVANASSASTPYLLWQWADDNSNTVANLLFSGDPGYLTQAAGLRWGDNIAVRGSGASTEILIAPGVETNGFGTNVVIFTTPDGFNFSPIVIGISGVSSGFAQNGLSFGPGANTFWAKTINQDLHLIQFDLNAQTGSVLYDFAPDNGVPKTFQFISANPAQTRLAGVMSVASGLPDNVRLYDISNLTNGPVLADQELNLTANMNGFNNGLGVGSSAFGGNYLFTLDAQNGLRGFLISTNVVLNTFNIVSIIPQAGPAVILTWESVSGHTYQLQAEGSLTGASWSDVGAPVLATGSSTSITNNLTGTAQFFRIQGQ